MKRKTPEMMSESGTFNMSRFRSLFQIELLNRTKRTEKGRRERWMHRCIAIHHTLIGGKTKLFFPSPIYSKWLLWCITRAWCFPGLDVSHVPHVMWLHTMMTFPQTETRSLSQYQSKQEMLFSLLLLCQIQYPRLIK